MRASILAAMLALAVPASAAASTQYFIPPGNSGGSEYLESVPTAGGSSPTNGLTRHGTGGSGSQGALPPSTQSSLSRFGSVGKQTAAFANRTAPAGTTGNASRGSSNGTAAGSSTGTATGSSTGTSHSGASASGGGGGAAGAGGTGSAAAAGLGSGGSSPAVSVVRSITGLSGHGGLGLLPLALLAVVLGIGGLAWRRRRAAD